MTAAAEPSDDRVPTIGILGGTGKLGAGLAVRWAAAGLPVTIGSRDPDRAARSAAELREALPTGAAVLDGVGNAEACARDIVVAAIPSEGAAELIGDLAERLAGRILVSALSPLAFDATGPSPGTVDGAPSAAELLADVAPGARVVAGFHTVSAVTLRREGPLDEDVLLCGDDDDAVARVAALVDDHLDGARAVHCGALRLAATLEALTAVLISVNKRHRAHAGIRITRL